MESGRERCFEIAEKKRGFFGTSSSRREMLQASSDDMFKVWVDALLMARAGQLRAASEAGASPSPSSELSASPLAQSPSVRSESAPAVATPGSQLPSLTPTEEVDEVQHEE